MAVTSHPVACTQQDDWLWVPDWGTTQTAGTLLPAWSLGPKHNVTCIPEAQDPARAAMACCDCLARSFLICVALAQICAEEMHPQPAQQDFPHELM